MIVVSGKRKTEIGFLQSPGTTCSNTPPVQIKENEDENLEEEDEIKRINDEHVTAIYIEDPQPEPSMEPQPGPSKRQRIM